MSGPYVLCSLTIAGAEVLENEHVWAYVRAHYGRWAASYAGTADYRSPDPRPGRVAMPANVVGWALASLSHILRGGAGQLPAKLVWAWCRRVREVAMELTRVEVVEIAIKGLHPSNPDPPVVPPAPRNGGGRDGQHGQRGARGRGAA